MIFIKQAHHKCEAKPNWLHVKVDFSNKDYWYIESEDSALRYNINYCPFCGIELSTDKLSDFIEVEE
jgi:hypothetical protein